MFLQSKILILAFAISGSWTSGKTGSRQWEHRRLRGIRNSGEGARGLSLRSTYFMLWFVTPVASPC